MRPAVGKERRRFVAPISGLVPAPVPPVFGPSESTKARVCRRYYLRRHPRRSAAHQKDSR
jgi:hypothetical protein